MTKTTVFIVEDEAIVAADLASKLRRLGYEVVGFAAGGAEAVALASRVRPHLVLMDICLEGPMDGIEAGEAIRCQQDVPVIYLTAHSDPATLARAKLTGPFGYILKPFEERELATQIEMALFRHQTDRQLRQEREWLRVTLTSIGDAVIATDAEGRISFINPVAASLTGWRAEDASGQPVQSVFRLVNEQTGEPLAEPVARVLREGRAVELANHAALVTRDGRSVPISESAAPILDAAGQVIGAVLVFHDVTERRQAEKTLRESRKDLDRAQAVAHCGSWRLNVQRNELVWSDENWRIFGVPRGTPLTYELFLDTVHPDDRALVDAKWSAALRGKPYEVEHRVVVAGQIKWVRETAELEFDPQGNLLGGFGTTQDITTKKHAEETLAAAKAAAEAANVAKSQFLANMSHELRTPMNAILGMIDVALPKATDPMVRDCLQTAKGSADLLLTLLNDLLDSAKIESGKLELESAPFSLRRMLDQIARVLSVRASEKGLRFSCRMPEGMTEAVVGDRMRLQQVLLNLAGNAIKFTERGEVEISLRALLQGGEACLEFAVRDTGIGIPPAGRERLFQPFGQADASMVRRFGGTGLGLSICKNLVELMGGRIWVESEVGLGSKFYFGVRLPLAKELPADLVAPETALPAASVPLRILLVEDNPANQKLATYILQDRGHRIEVASSGQEAIAFIQQNRYDVILMDVQMPGMNGCEATAVIRAAERATGAIRRNGPEDASHEPDSVFVPTRVPIIAMTAHAMKGVREHCLAAGMDGYLSKPINAQELITLVETLAARAQAVTAGPPADAAARPAAGVIFDAELALQRCLNKPRLVAEMIQCFLADANSLLPQIRAALAKGDLPEMGQLGHRLKGTVVYLGAEPVREAAQRVERFGKSSDGTRSEAEAAVAELEHACLELRAALREHLLAAEPKSSD